MFVLVVAMAKGVAVRVAVIIVVYRWREWICYKKIHDNTIVVS